MFDAGSLIRAHIRDLDAYEPIRPFEVLAEQLGRAPETIIKLDANENPYGPPDAVQAALAELEYPHIYPDPQCTALRQALAAHTGVPVDNLLAGAGADELIDLTMRLLLEPGDAILNCPPTFGMYQFDAGVNGARVVSVPRRADFSLDVEAVEAAVASESPKLLFLANPNNPDGSLTSRATLERLLALPLLFILDEAYIEFAEAGCSCLAMVAGSENLIVLRTFSKWAGLAGLRVGYSAFPTSLMAQLWKIKQPYNVSVSAQAAACAALKEIAVLDDIGAKLIAERERLATALETLPYLQPYPSQANFILCRVVKRSAHGVKDALAEDGILVRYFDKPGLRDHIRISVGRPEHTDRLMAALERLV